MMWRRMSMQLALVFIGGSGVLAAADYGSPAVVDPDVQTERHWVDDRFSKMETGPFLNASIQTPGRITPKGIAIKIGDRQQATVCFDTDLMRYSAGWTGGFLQLDSRRYGLLVAPRVDGDIQFSTQPDPGWGRNRSFFDPRPNKWGRLPDGWAKFHGLYRHGEKVILSYSVDQKAVLDQPWIVSDMNIFTRTLEVAPSDSSMHLLLADVPGGEAEVTTEEGIQFGKIIKGDMFLGFAAMGADAGLDDRQDGRMIGYLLSHSRVSQSRFFTWRGSADQWELFKRTVVEHAIPNELAVLTDGGPGLWEEELVTEGFQGQPNELFQIESIQLPFENPWNALLFTSGHDFFANGDVAVSTAHGDVWRVSGLDDELKSVRWKRFASGLNQPLGLKIVRNRAYVLERDQITRLIDLNGDGETDYYECFNNDVISKGQDHAYATCLETDPAGNFYFLKSSEPTPHGGSLLKVSADGATLETVATGFRNPNGMGIGPDGSITAADQQGNWVPETRLDWIEPGGFYGFMPMHHRENEPETYDPPLVWIPRVLDNSAGGQVWVPEGHWGPFSGKLLHLSYGRCTFMMVLRDRRSEVPQGAVVSLPGRFQSGVMRGRFHPLDGHLYLTGLRGWQTAAVQDGCLQRVRYVGGEACLPIGFRVVPKGIEIEFNKPLERELAEGAAGYSVEQWNYRWSGEYGSPDYSARRPGEQGRDSVRVVAARLSPDGTTVSLDLEDFQPVMSMAIRYSLDTAEGGIAEGELFATINDIPEENDFERRQEIVIEDPPLLEEEAAEPQ